ncbi:permease [Candidatus Woesearchaeota archaeon]|jgi:uncharacterized protein|nr:permease [Candidatus Woesearchaeota archaeon]MBT3538344.1 permease [Candidatus Woesearchaeota archaeon]MBT4698321.1 permease [Candidatus Woesearchaeota archaeon]MBT4716780.1 permease [Candidatus Woesearchaeota archaeon]MBT7106013.1 permease [Candidatus Woesearchaeota archaeon]
MLEATINWLFFSILQLDATSHLVESLRFFVYDSIKILLLLYVMIAVVGYFRTYISSKKLRNWLSNKAGVLSNFFASLFGAITPFCSCSSIPLFIGFIKAGVPLGVSFSFLITSPLVNEYLVVLMLGFFGWKITALYVVFGILLGAVLGSLAGYFKLDKFLVRDIASRSSKAFKDVKYTSFKSRIRFGLDEACDIVKKLWLWVLVGVGLGAMIHNYVPQEWIQGVVDGTGIFAVPLATLVGVPMYGSCAAIVPIAIALFNKGIPLGTALAFMMATSALSLPEAVILRRAMKLPLILLFFVFVTIGIIVVGYLFNYFQFIVF